MSETGVYDFLALRGAAEEAPGAYKDVDRVVSVVERAGLAAPVARLVPLVREFLARGAPAAKHAAAR